MAEDERFYVVDENDEVVGWASRSECHRKGLIHRSVYVIVLNDRGEVFLQRRSMNKDLYPGLYACSATGHVEYGESYEEAARRELMEELGINAQLKWIGKFRCFSNVEREISALYICYHNGPFNLNSEEISEGRFVSIAEIKRMLEDGGREFAYGSVLALKELIRSLEYGGH
ncbi:MAG: NUDIX domain-containing protein [Candidatus Bathyarchaeia archaeon]